MQELISTPIEARIHLNKISGIEEALIDVIKSKRVSRSTTTRISELYDLLQFCERDEKDIEIVNIILEEAKFGREVATTDIVKIVDVLHDCKNELESFIKESFEEQLVKNVISENEYKEHLFSLTSCIEEEISTDKEMKKRETQKVIYDHPGHYIKNLYAYLEKKLGKNTITYTTIWNYVNELVDDGEIITIGGHQGRFRYCFPNPQKIQDRTTYYDKYFAVACATVKEKVTNSFKSTGYCKKYYDFYILNSSIKQEIILAVGFSAPIPLNSKASLGAYGDLEPFKFLQEKEGYILKNGLKEMDILLARRVVEVIGGKEKEIWSEPSKVFLTPQL